jgi:hypothetical protein
MYIPTNGVNSWIYNFRLHRIFSAASSLGFLMVVLYMNPLQADSIARAIFAMVLGTIQYCCARYTFQRIYKQTMRSRRLLYLHPTAATRMTKEEKTYQALLPYWEALRSLHELQFMWKPSFDKRLWPLINMSADRLAQHLRGQDQKFFLGSLTTEQYPREVATKREKDFVIELASFHQQLNEWLENPPVKR